MKKLEKYSKFINMAWNDKLALLKNTKQEDDSSEFTIQRKYYEEENFINLTSFDSKNTETLYKLRTYRQNAKSGKPKAVIALFNGLGSHTNLGGHVAHYFAERGITTVGFDYRGFGKSQGSPCYIESIQSHMADVEKFVKLVKEIYPQTPLFAGGLSLGGMTAYLLTLKNPEMFKGAILMAPALRTAMERQKSINSVIKLSKFIQFFIPEKLALYKGSYDSLCRFPRPLEQLKKDQMYLKKRMPIRTLITVSQAMTKLPQTFSEYRTPFMVIIGGRDRFVDPHAAFDLIEKSKTAEEDKEILFFEDMWHVITYQPEIIEIQEKIADWMLQRC